MDAVDFSGHGGLAATVKILFERVRGDEEAGEKVAVDKALRIIAEGGSSVGDDDRSGFDRELDT